MSSLRTIRVVTVALVGLIAGCAAPPASPPAPAAAPTSAPAKPAEAAKPAAPAPAAPAAASKPAAKSQFESEIVNPAPFKQGGTLRMAHEDTSLHLDPTLSNSNTTHKRVSLIYQHLIAFRPDPKDSRESVYEGQVAEKWDVTPDGKSVTFFLRKDIKWANDPEGLLKGRPLTAQDVLFSFNRWRMESAPKANIFKNITEVQVVDDHTVKFHFAKASPQNLAILASDPAWIMPKEPVDKYGDLKTWGYGFGPYNITKHDPNTATTFERNPTHYEAEKIGPDKMEVVVMKDKSTAIAAFRSGQTDFIGNGAHLDVAITAEDAKEIKRSNPEATQITIPRLGMAAALVLRFNCQCPFDNLKVRQALAHAIDRDALIQAIRQGDGYFTDIFPSQGFPKYASPDAKLKEWFKYDPELSKKLLAEAGFPNGFTTPILWNTDDQQQRRLLDIEVQMLSKVGIKLDTQALGKAYPAWTGDIFSGRYPEIGQWGYIGSTVWNFFDCIVYAGGCRNGSRMDDPKVNQAIERILYDLKEEQRPDEVRKLNEYLFTEALYVQPLFNDYYHWMIQPWIKNVRVERGGDAIGVYHLDELAYVSIQR